MEAFVQLACADACLCQPKLTTANVFFLRKDDCKCFFFCEKTTANVWRQHIIWYHCALSYRFYEKVSSLVHLQHCEKENGAINNRKLLICPVKFQMTVPESEDRTEKTRERNGETRQKKEPHHHVPWARDKQAKNNVHLVKLISRKLSTSNWTPAMLVMLFCSWMCHTSLILQPIRVYG
jgi:hypothetical protein